MNENIKSLYSIKNVGFSYEQIQSIIVIFAAEIEKIGAQKFVETFILDQSSVTLEDVA